MPPPPTLLPLLSENNFPFIQSLTSFLEDEILARSPTGKQEDNNDEGG
jgi:hypothetical protein